MFTKQLVDEVYAKGTNKFTEQHKCDMCGNYRACYERKIVRDGKEIHVCQECLDKEYMTLALIPEGYDPEDPEDPVIFPFNPEYPPTEEEMAKAFSEEEQIYLVYVGMDFRFYGISKERVLVKGNKNA